jgi:hypothetical protein
MLSRRCGPGSRGQAGPADGIIPGTGGPRPPGPAACRAEAPAAGKTRLQPAALGGVLALAAVLAAGCVSIRFTPGRTPHVAAARASRPCPGVSFHHPPGWQERSVAMRVAGTGRLCQTGLFIGPSDAIAISAWLQPRPITDGNLAAATPIITGQIRQLASRGGGALEAGPRRIRVGGLPALWFRVSGLSYSGARVDSTLVLAFDGKIHYELICQHTPPHAAQVADACRQVLRTFTVTSPVKPASAPTGTVAAPPTSTQRWLTGLAAVQAHMTNAGPPSGVPVTPDSLRLTAAKLRRCTAQLTALGRPPRPLRAVYRQARQACADFERGARCYTAAAASALNSAQAGKLLNSCAADTNNGSDLIGLAVAEGSSLSQQN